MVRQPLLIPSTNIVTKRPLVRPVHLYKANKAVSTPSVVGVDCTKKKVTGVNRWVELVHSVSSSNGSYILSVQLCAVSV